MSTRRKVRITAKQYDLTRSLINESAASVTVGVTTDLSDIDGNYILASGDGVSISGFGPVQAGAQRVIKFSGINTLVHNNPRLVLPAETDITTSEGDVGTFRSDGDGNWRCIAYTSSSGRALAPARFSATNPGDPTGTTSGVSVMMGLSCTFTPSRAGALQVTLTANMQTDTAGSEVRASLRYGTGAAPANADADSGTLVGGTAVSTMVDASKKVPFCLTAIIADVARDTEVWIDVALSNGGDASEAQISDIYCSIIEL